MKIQRSLLKPREAPNAENAMIDIRKLRDYFLNLEHSDSKYKARLFREKSGCTAKNAALLQQTLREIILTRETTVVSRPFRS